MKKTALFILLGICLIAVRNKPVLAQEGQDTTATPAIPDTPIALPGTNQRDSAATFLQKVETFTTGDSEQVTFQYIEVPDRPSLLELSQKLTDPSNYPVVILKKDVFGPGVKIIKTLDLQILNYELRDRQWQVLDSIHVEKFNKLEEIVSLQEARVAVYDSANVQLREQIDQLNDQLDASVDLTRKTIRARQIKNLWIGALGGVFGFSVGVLISALN